jgi:hypothetical protein
MKGGLAYGQLWLLERRLDMRKISSSCRRPVLRFELGDRVIVRATGLEGIVVGVRYGEMAVDVRCGMNYLRNVAPDQVRLAPPPLAIVA